MERSGGVKLVERTLQTSQVVLFSSSQRVKPVGHLCPKTRAEKESGAGNQEQGIGGSRVYAINTPGVYLVLIINRLEEMCTRARGEVQCYVCEPRRSPPT